jgi:tripartite-type tricarboxylate transporter receptor subunit TctC
MKFFGLIFTLMFTSVAHAWEPTKPVNVIIGMTPGSAMDNAFRIVSTQVEKNTGVKFIPNYRPGVGGAISSDLMTRTDADGYTFLTGSNPALAATDRMGVPNKTYTVSDFTYAMSYASTTMTIIAHPNDPVNSIQDFIKAMRTEKPIIGDPGGAARLTWELLRDNIKFNESINDVVRVEYKGPVEALQDVVAKNTRFAVVPLAISSQNHIGNRVKIIAVTSATPVSMFPNIPTVSTVYPNLVFNLTWSVVLPKNTPAPIVDWYTREFNKALQSKEVQQTMQDNFYFVDKKLLSSKELRAQMLADEKKYEPLVNRVLEQRK